MSFRLSAICACCVVEIKYQDFVAGWRSPGFRCSLRRRSCLSKVPVIPFRRPIGLPQSRDPRSGEVLGALSPKHRFSSLEKALHVGQLELRDDSSHVT